MTICNGRVWNDGPGKPCSVMKTCMLLCGPEKKMRSLPPTKWPVPALDAVKAPTLKPAQPTASPSLMNKSTTNTSNVDAGVRPRALTSTSASRKSEAPPPLKRSVACPIAAEPDGGMLQDANGPASPPCAVRVTAEAGEAGRTATRTAALTAAAANRRIPDTGNTLRVPDA